MKWGVGAALLAVWTGASVLAQEAPASAINPPAAPILAVSPWDWSLQLRAGGGYKDNLLISDFNKESSAFSLTEAELFVFRAPVDGWEFSGLLTAEDRRFWQSPTLDKEQTLLGNVDVRKGFAKIWKAGLNLQYYYTDQIFDASVSEGLPLRIPAKGHRFSGGPWSQVALPGKMRLELSMPVARQNFEVPLDDSWELGPKLLLGWTYGNRSDLTASVQWKERTYDERASVFGRSLSLDIWNFETGVRHYWDAARHWRSRAQAGLELDSDNGGGFYNYRKWHFSQSFDYVGNKIEAGVKARFSHYEFENQFVAPMGRARRLSEVTLGWRARKPISKTWSLFAEGQYEWALATDLTERYNTATIWGGIEWAPK